jgi:antitoxin component YwqK of YwqJK toxin-antitoxin module
MKPSEIDVLSKEYVIEHGTEFDGEEICWGGDYGDLVCSSEGVPFTGLLFELYRNGNLAYYSYYEKGRQHGLSIRFHVSGNIESCGVFAGGFPVGKSYEWYDSGKLKLIRDHYKNDYHYKYTEYYENEDIVRQGEA